MDRCSVDGGNITDHSISLGEDRGGGEGIGILASGGKGLSKAVLRCVDRVQIDMRRKGLDKPMHILVNRHPGHSIHREHREPTIANTSSNFPLDILGALSPQLPRRAISRLPTPSVHSGVHSQDSSSSAIKVSLSRCYHRLHNIDAIINDGHGVQPRYKDIVRKVNAGQGQRSDSTQGLSNLRIKIVHKINGLLARKEKEDRQ